jgi:hypothetical protein
MSKTIAASEASQRGCRCVVSHVMQGCGSLLAWPTIPTLVEFVCQRCGETAHRRAALHPPALEACPACEGRLQALRVISADGQREHELAQRAERIVHE